MTMRFAHISFAGTALSLILSFVGWLMPSFGAVAALMLSAVIFFLYVKKPAWAVSAIIAELAFGGKGWWLALQIGDIEIPVRMMMFGMVMAAWGVKELKSHDVMQSVREYGVRSTYALGLLGLVIIWGTGWGIVRGNSYAAVFLDANGWWYWLLIFPMLAVVKDAKGIQRIMECVLGACLATAILTLALYHVFDHQYAIAATLYPWTRDTLLGEITFIRPGAWRIFMQSQVWLLLAWAWAAGRALSRNRLACHEISMILLSSSALIISFSRSFWIGWGAAIILFISVSVFRLRAWKRAVGIVAISLIGGFILASALQRIPPVPAGFPLKERISLDAAGSSRIAQLTPLLKAIVQHPVLGSGFGTTVTYASADPRIVESTPGGSGSYTTYAFEWGYLDMWLKIGLIGLISLIGLIGVAVIQLWRIVKEEEGERQGVALTLFITISGLMAVNIFSPYLNHPLGIGLVMAGIAAVKAYETKEMRDASPCSA